MYIDRFINNKYIALLRYCKNINKDNSIIVDLKYGKRNKTLLLRKVGKNLKFNATYLRKFLFKIRNSNKIILNTKKAIYLHEIKLKKKLKLFLKQLSKLKAPLKFKQLKENQFRKYLKQNLLKFTKDRDRLIQNKI
jgi:hypothetical protein